MDEDIPFEDIPFVDQRRLIRYIQAALALGDAPLDADVIGRVLDLELEYLQHQGIAEQALDAPRPEG